MTKDKVESLLDNLSETLRDGWIYYHCAKSLNKAYTNHRITCARIFFMGCYTACLIESVLSLSKLLIDHQDSVSLHFLLNYARKTPSSFPFGTPDRIIQVINESETQLIKFEPLRQIIKFNRDKSIAHIDRKHITNPTEILEKSNINMIDVEACYHEIHKIINRFMGLQKSSELYLASFEKDIPEDLDFLLGLIEEADFKLD